jgi:hypothetical protein
MTDYFDALIRASGLAAERRPAAAGSETTAMEPGVTSVAATELNELDVEQVAAPVERVEPPAASAEPSPALPAPAAPVSGRDQTRNEPVVSTARDAVPPVTDDDVAREPQTSSTPSAAPTDAGPAPPPRGAAAPLDHAAIASSRERIVRAALDWVAADPMRLAIPPPAAPGSPAPSPPQARERAPRPARPQAREDSVRPDSGASEIRPQARLAVGQVEPAPPFTPGEPPSLAVTPRAQRGIPIEPASAIERPAPRAIADHGPRQQNEVVEVSIGAIHVRVDAPAPPPAAPAPPAPRTPLPASRPGLDGLRRRALRRI